MGGHCFQSCNVIARSKQETYAKDFPSKTAGGATAANTTKIM
jgi:hypothetical protein